MKKTLVFVCLLVCVLFSVLAAAAFDQNGNDHWCNSDADGCWVTGEAGEKVYIMFWSDAAREKFMGKGSKATTCPPLPAGKASMPGAPESASASIDAEALCEQLGGSWEYDKEEKEYYCLLSDSN